MRRQQGHPPRLTTPKLFLLVCGMAPSCFAGPDFTGSAVFESGLIANGSWAGSSLQLNWTVYQDPDGSWYYDYVLIVPEKDISHVVFEAPPTFRQDDLFSLTWPDKLTEVGMHTSANGNPDIPASFYGIKFDSPKEGSTSWHIRFATWQGPAWGDFYARDGRTGQGWNSAWNLGFTGPDTDPADPPQDGSIANHVLVPGAPRVQSPESGTLMLVGLALLILPAMLRWRMSRR